MAVTYPVIRDGLYCGTITEEHEKLILETREAEVISGLEHMIFDFPTELVIRSLEEDRSIRDIIKEEQIDYNQYLGKLRYYQTVGAAFLYMSPRSMIGDGVGLGKTAEISALINMLKEKGQLTKFLIAVEGSAFGQTQYELMKFTGMKIVALPSEAPKMKRMIQKTDWRTVDGVIIKHSALKSSVLSKWLSIYLDENGMSRIFNTFFLDESSVIKNDKTKVYEYTKNICNICKRVHFMNATAFETNIMDIYYQIDMLDENLLPKKWRIQNKYCTYRTGSYWNRDEEGKPKKNFKREFVEYKNQHEFRDSLRLVYLGRCKKDVGMDIAHEYKVYEVEPSLKQSVALADESRYIEVLNSPETMPELGISMTRKDVPKLDRLCSLIQNELDGQQVMIYCMHIEAQKGIKRELEAIGKKCVILNGQDKSSEKDKNRLKAMNEFNNGIYDVIITNIQKSLNLPGGDVCIFYEYPPNPSKLQQVQGRIDRNVDDKKKTFILLLYKGTAEYNYFMNVVKQRAKDARDLIIDAEGAVDYFIKSIEENGIYE